MSFIERCGVGHDPKCHRVGANLPSVPNPYAVVAASSYTEYGGGPAVGAPSASWNAPAHTVTRQPYLTSYASAM